MSILEIIGYAGAVVVGLVLGLLGGGGAAMSIPILVYAFAVPASVATGYSLLIVGCTALLGTLQNLRKGLVRYKALLYCGIPALVSIYIMRRFLIHLVPEVFFTIGTYTLTKNSFILLLLAFFMTLVARNMIVSPPSKEDSSNSTHYAWHFAQSVLIGLFTGLVGAGGGFLLIPLILSYEKMEFRNATATSLALVTLNSFIGFIGDIQSQSSMNWRFLMCFVGCSAVGVLLGIALANKTDNKGLRLIFGYVMLCIALYIMVKEVILKFL